MATQKQTKAEKAAEKRHVQTAEAEARLTDSAAADEVAKKGAAAKEAKKDPKKPDVLDDLSTQDDAMASMGHFVNVVAGPHEGTYGVLVENAEGDNVVVRTRDAASERILVAYGDLRPADPGKF